jgi:hypothetical protein
MWGNLNDALAREMDVFVAKLAKGLPLRTCMDELAEGLPLNRAQFAKVLVYSFAGYFIFSLIFLGIVGSSWSYVLSLEERPKWMLGLFGSIGIFWIGMTSYLPGVIGRAKAAGINYNFVFPVFAIFLFWPTIFLIPHLPLIKKYLFLSMVGYSVLFNIALLLKKSTTHQKSEKGQDSNFQSENKREEFSSEDHYYQVLGITRVVSKDELKNAYRNLITKYHPDKVSHLGEEFIRIAEKRSKEINKAYEFLKTKHGDS